MCFGMDSRTNFLVLVEILLWVAPSSSATFDSYPAIRDGIPSPAYFPEGLSPPEDLLPGLNYAYAEVDTPFYHYYFYAPAFKKSSHKEFHVVPTSRVGYTSYYKTLGVPEENVYNPGEDGSPFSPSFRNEYNSPQFNDVRYPSREVSTHNPKTYTDRFLDTPYSTTFHPRKVFYPYQNPTTINLPRSFLPSALSSDTSNIIRKEDQGRKIHSDVRPDSYAPSYNDHEPHPIFEPTSPSYQPPLIPYLLSASTPIIIRDEVPQINKLFKPISSAHKNTDISSNFPTSLTTSYPFTTQNAIQDRNDYNNPASIFSPVSPNTLSPTRPPPLFRTSELPDFSTMEETLSPIFTSRPTPLEHHTTPVSIGAQGPTVYLSSSTISPESPRVRFEAPGHTQPRRR